MGELVAGLVVILVLAGIAGLVALAVDRGRRSRAREAVSSVRQAVWEVAEQGGRAHAGGVTRVFVRKVTAAGEEVDRVPVAEVPNSAEDWQSRVLEARAVAAERAALLNTAP